MGVACRLYERVENAYKVLVTKPEKAAWKAWAQITKKY